MAETNLNFAKIVANPNVYSWSQAYNAGKLFSVLSLEKFDQTGEEKDFLGVLGKEIFNTLEQEFFTLESKNLESIKSAIKTTAEKIPDGVNCSFVIGFIAGNILYIFILGNGKVDIKRNDKLGNLLSSKDSSKENIKASSGYLEEGDYIFLETDQFANIISAETLSSHLENKKPEEVSEEIAPILHEREEAAAAAIILEYKGEEKPSILTAPIEELEKQAENPFGIESSQEKSSSKLLDSAKTFALGLVSKIKIPSIKGFSFSGGRKIILIAAVIIVAVFVFSIYKGLQKQQNDKYEAAFQAFYPQAQKKYDEGQSLMDLNQSLAKDSFQQAQKILNDNKDKFPAKSTQEKQIQDLLSKVNSALGGGGASNQSNQVTPEEVDSSVSPILATEIKYNSSSYFTQDDQNIYFIDSAGIESVSKQGGTKKKIIDSSELPKNVGGLSVYYGNFYVVDKDTNQITKFIAATDGFGKTDYLKGTNNISNSISIAIDSDLWLLQKSGSLLQFTKGNNDNLSVSGLSTPLSSPTRVSTTLGENNVYILDNGNSRIVVLDKKGNFVNQYQAEILKQAKDFEVSETSKRAFVLSGGKVYQINLK